MHNIEYFDYEENIKRDWVQQKLDHYAAMEDWQEGCSGLGHPIRWLEKLPVCADYEAAQQVIQTNDKGWYDQLAVRYYEPKRGFTNTKVKELEQKEADAWKAYREKDSCWAAGLKSEYVSCRYCGSKLRRQYISVNRCPVCHKDLRPDSLLKSVEAAHIRAKKAQETLKKYKLDHAGKTVRWLVKIEYHT